MRMWAKVAAAALGLVLAGCTPAAKGPEGIDSKRIAAPAPGEWLSHGRDYKEQRFSPLAAVNAANVKDLGLAWSYEYRVGRGASATPIVVDGVMYVTSAWSIVYALDAKTGAEKWVYDPKVPRAKGADACCDVVNRGVALYRGKVFVGALDGRLIALDAKTGKEVWSTVTVDQAQPYTITGAPRASNGLVYIGNGGAEYGVRGYVSAYDAETGKLVWRFYTVPGDPAKGPDRAASDPQMEMAGKTWNGEFWKAGGGGTVWDAIVVDPEFNQLIVGVGNGSPWNQQVRSPGGGDNLFLSSILALDLKTGAYKWHYQTTPGDTWDYTATQPIMLADLTIEGKPRKVAMQAPKNGFFYVIDRANGALISAKPIVPMAPVEKTPPGMPVSWSTGEIDAAGRPVENAVARYKAGTAVVHPSTYGAHNWHPMAFSPETGLVYIPAQMMAMDWTTDPAYVLRPGRWNTGTVHAALPTDEPVRDAIRNSLTGFLLAWDPVAQKEVWRAPLAGPWNGGALATAGGLVFQGGVDGIFRAFDAKTGQELWRFDNQAATQAGPIAYEIDGEQYVAVNAGYGSVFFLVAGFVAPRPGHALNSRMYVFKLGGAAAAPKLDLAVAETPAPPAIRVSAATMARGEFVYGQFCVICHGAAAISGGVLPDLRRSPILADAEGWKGVVIDGVKADLGMPAHAKWITAADAEAIRAYVAREAQRQYAKEQTRKK
jgi:quinohemoprotein ethanol dehydrogenase